MLTFINPGLIDEVALTTSGVSAKIGDNPIGKFGTGVKYAIAIVLRLGGHVVVYRGKKRLEFDRKEKTIRGQVFNIVTMNGRELGYTDQLGMNWEPWMAYREFWSNCRDEGGRVSRPEQGIDEYDPAARQTAILIECPELERTHDERHKIILQTEPLVVMPGLEIHAGTSEHVYYRGIRIAHVPGTNVKSLYTYNLTSDQTLTEDRTLAYQWALPTTVATGIVQCTNLSILHDVLGEVGEKMWEGKLPYASMKSVKPSPQFMEAAEQLSAMKKLGSGARTLFNDYRDTMPGYQSPYLVTLSPLEEEIVSRALHLVAAAGLGLTRGEINFKSQINLGLVNASKREGMALAHGLLLQGAESLACAMVEGLAQMAGGSPVGQLSAFVVTGKFADKDRVSSGRYNAFVDEH